MKTKINFALIAGIVLMSCFTACLEEIKDNITVSFDSRGGNNIGSVTLERGQSLGGSYPTPKKDGAVFSAWYDGFTEYKKDTAIYVDVTLLAHWEDDMATVTFDTDNGTPVFAPIKVPKGGTLGVRFPINPRKKGFVFENWLYGETVLDRDTPITDNITAKAKWGQSTEYTVTFDTGTGATTINSITVYDGDGIDEWENRYSTFKPQYTDEVPLPATGRAFKEWIYDPTGQNIIYTGRTPVTRNITLVAQWRYIIDEQSFNIDLDYCLDVPGAEYEATVGAGDHEDIAIRHEGDNHPLLNYPVPTTEKVGDNYVFTFEGKNSGIAIETSPELRELLLVANSVTVEVEGTVAPADRLFRLLIGNTVIYAEGWNLTDNHKPDAMIPFEQLKEKDLVINEVNRTNKPTNVDYVFIQTNRDNAQNGIEQTTVATIKSIKITVK